MRRFIIFTIFSNSFYQILAIKGTFIDENENTESKIMQGIYNLCVIAAIILVYFSYKFEHKVSLKIMAFAIIIFRNNIRLFDFENSKTSNKSGEEINFSLEVDNDLPSSVVVISPDFVLT